MCIKMSIYPYQHFCQLVLYHIMQTKTIDLSTPSSLLTYSTYLIAPLTILTLSFLTFHFSSHSNHSNHSSNVFKMPSIFIFGLSLLGFFAALDGQWSWFTWVFYGLVHVQVVRVDKNLKNVQPINVGLIGKLIMVALILEVLLLTMDRENVSILSIVVVNLAVGLQFCTITLILNHLRPLELFIAHCIHFIARRTRHFCPKGTSTRPKSIMTARQIYRQLFPKHDLQKDIKLDRTQLLNKTSIVFYCFTILFNCRWISLSFLCLYSIATECQWIREGLSRLWREVKEEMKKEMEKKEEEERRWRWRRQLKCRGRSQQLSGQEKENEGVGKEGGERGMRVIEILGRDGRMTPRSHYSLMVITKQQ